MAALYTLYHYDDPLQPLREARRVLQSGGLLAACAPARDSAPELAHVVPSWGARSTFDAEDAPASSPTRVAPRQPGLPSSPAPATLAIPHRPLACRSDSTSLS